MTPPDEEGNGGPPMRFRDVEGLIPLLLAACGDPAMKAQLETIIDLPADKREVGLRRLIDHLRERRAPAQLTDAIICLLDDGLVRKVKEALRRC